MANDDIKLIVSDVVNLSSRYNEEEAVKELVTAFRKLRNKCAEGVSVQNEIASFDNLVDSTFRVLQGIIDTSDTTDSHDLCLLVGLQLIANLLVQNKDIQSRVWERYKKNLISFLWYDNPKVQNCAVMVMYNVFLDHTDYIVLDKDIFLQIIHLITISNSSEFAIYLLHLYIKKTKYIQKIYHAEPDLRPKVLDVILNFIVKEDEALGREILCFFVEKFLNYSENFIDELTFPECSIEACEAVKILDLLSNIAGVESDLKVIQSEEALLITCVKLLKEIHTISKEPGNNLSRIQRLSELDNLESRAELQENFCFGVKAKLIRLIGNMCWENKCYQNKVRELDAIPVLLDCCSIDGRNPFISQWTILAIRNLCNNNKENQKFIASVGIKGVVDFNKMKEMGILLNKETDGS